MARLGPPLYQKLPTPTSIRLLSFESTVDNEIQTRLVVAKDVARAPPYCALSYEWGDALDPAIIRCNGRPVEVTRNLSNALRYFCPDLGDAKPGVDTDAEVNGLDADDNVWSGIAIRRREQSLEERAPSYLWIDALCINQEDEEEKTKQVIMMRQIYETADTVLVWLGQGGPDTVYAVSFIAQALQNLEEERRTCRREWTGTKTEQYSRALNRGRGFRNLYGDDFGYYNRHWGALARFCDNSYFLRIWIIQEIAVARRVKAICGDFEIAFDALGAAAVWFVKKGYIEHAPKLSGLRDVAFLWLRNQSTKNGKRTHLLDLMQETRRYQASRSVDRVFALIGLAQEGQGNSELLRIDYERPEADVFRNVTRFLIHEYKTLQPLASVNHENLEMVGDGVPTWASTPGASNDLFEAAYRRASTSGATATFKPYQAGSDEALFLGESCSLHRLVVRGVQFDIVENCSAPLRFRDQVDWERRTMRQMFKVLREKHGDSNVYSHTGEELIDVFFLTCAASTPTRCLYRYIEEDEDPYMVATVLAGFYQLAGAQDRKWTSAEFDKGPTFLKEKCANRRMFLTKSGFFGVGPVGMQTGDVIAVPFGGELPFVLRKQTNKERHYFVGNSYVHGLMLGKAVHAWRNGELKDEYLELE